METFLFTIEDAIYFKDLGLVICPGISHENLPLRVGQPITIMRPDGTELTTFVKQFPMIRRSVYLDSVLVTLPRNIMAEDVPIGSQVWLLDVDERTTP